MAEHPTGESGHPSENDDEQVKELQHRPNNHWKSSGDISLALLLTCRQIYNEAVLVPFSDNDFAININLFTSDDRVMIPFLCDLVPDQIRAISSLHIRGVTRYGLVLQHVKALSGLKRLKLGFDWNMMAVRRSPDLLMAELEDHSESSHVSMFAGANLQTVDFNIDLTVFLHDVQAVLAQEKELIDLVESKRALLLTKQTPVASKRRAGTVASQPARLSERIRAQKEKAKVSDEQWCLDQGNA